MRARGLLSFVAFTAAFVVVPADAKTYPVNERDCKFQANQQVRFVDPGDSVIFYYAESVGDDCYQQNHRVKTYSGPSSFDSNPNCGTPAPLNGSCMNDTVGDQQWTTPQLVQPGTYFYYCPFHGNPTPAMDLAACGMCGKIVINAQSSPTTTPTATATTTARPTGSKSPSPTSSPSLTVSPTATTSVSVSPTSTVSPVGEKNTGGGGGRVWIALAAIALLTTLALLVWRAFLAQRA